ncbi:MAG: hypothetical protein OEV43_05055 [Coriobacteriia bacterium]|nr:hypothetical protein [Coriobacteriia bacterium]
MSTASRRRRSRSEAGIARRVRLARIPAALALLAVCALLAVVAFGGCSPGGSSADTDWARIAQDEEWASVTDEEFDELLDSFVEENTAFAAETPIAYLEPMAIVIGASSEDPESRGAETHILAFDGTEEGTTRAMRDLGGLVARSGQRPLAVFLIAEADPDTLSVLPGVDSVGSTNATGSVLLAKDRALLTMGMTVDGRGNEAVQGIVANADGTVAVGPAETLHHVADESEVGTDLLTAFFQGYAEGASK